ncbi:MAG TPA: hypothetical protein VD864_13815 [Nocardioides sp.]|nr:hypothetical protein [Nocardioides sp.]
MSLHDELQRIADRAPVADVPPDTWQRARRARTRDRALALGAAVGVVALVAGGMAWLPDRSEPPVADSDAGAALPTVLHAVPERFATYDEQEGRWPDDIVTGDLAVGPAVAAWVSWDTLPVVVGASDGRYHLLDLPGWTGRSLLLANGLPPALALSPEGDTLAFPYADFGPEAASEPIPSGVRLLDLVSGQVDDVPLPGEEGTAVTALAWSVDGRTLGWAGARLGSWTQDSYGQRSAAAGTIDPDTGTVDEIEDPRLLRRVADSAWGTLRAADDGSLSVVRTPGPNAPREVARLPDGGRLVIAPHPEDDSPTRSIELVGLDGPQLGVASIEDGTARSLTVAVGLLDPDHPSLDRPAPDWPWSDERKVVVFGGTGLAVLVLLVVAAAVRPQRRHPR